MAKNSTATGAYRNAILRRLSPDVLSRLAPNAVEPPTQQSSLRTEHRNSVRLFPRSGRHLCDCRHARRQQHRSRHDRPRGDGLFDAPAGDPHRSLSLFHSGGRPWSPGSSGCAHFDCGRESGTTTGRPAVRGDVPHADHAVRRLQRIASHRTTVLPLDSHDSRSGRLRRFKLSHEFLALMLGVRRSSVTDVLAPLQELGLLRSSRGTITILNREALKKRVCECYWVMVRREREQA
jgi:hypothetical protein